MKYEPVIGLEVHLHLSTKTKAFCGCSTQFGNQPNSQVCPVCLGFPGSLPALNKTAFDYAIKVALALNCAIQERTKFDRKHYYYPDLPKNYQISQYDQPLCGKGYLEIGGHKIGITRIHLEEDTGSLMHPEGADYSLVNFIGNKTKVIIICRMHGKFSCTPYIHLKSNGCGCNECGEISRSNKRKMTAINFFDKANKKHEGKCYLERRLRKM